MRKISSALGIIMIIMSWPVRILASPANHIVIGEIQTGSISDSSQEFVELYNPTKDSVSLENWTLEYASSAGITWTKKATLNGSIPAYGFYLISTNGYANGDAVMTSGLAGSGGHIRIKNMNNLVIDLVGWGSAAHAEGAPAAAASSGTSIERIPGRLNSLAGNGEDSDNNQNDFIAREVAEPQRISSAIEDPALVLVEPPEIEPVDEPPVVSPVYLPISITELFPDPDSPLTDAKDEFIELYNPNDVPVSLKGYTIRVGSGFKSYYTLSDTTILPGSYLSLYPTETKLGLTNSGGAAQLLDPSGAVLDVTDAYSAAKPGQSWADINGEWRWTVEPTPGAANIYNEPAGKVSASTSASKATTKKSATKKATTKKATVKKTSKVKAKKAKAKTKKTGIAAATTAITEPSPLARRLLIAAGCFTIMYAIYGFRHDLFNYYIKTRRNLTTWLQDRPAVPWRRNN